MLTDERYARRIAARGITPNHYGKRVRVGNSVGLLNQFEHFNETTVISLYHPAAALVDRITEHDLRHLEEVTVYD